MTQPEIEQLKALLETLEAGDTGAAIEWLRAAIKLTEKEKGMKDELTEAAIADMEFRQSLPEKLRNAPHNHIPALRFIKEQKDDFLLSMVAWMSGIARLMAQHAANEVRRRELEIAAYEKKHRNHTHSAKEDCIDDIVQWLEAQVKE